MIRKLLQGWLLLLLIVGICLQVAFFFYSAPKTHAEILLDCQRFGLMATYVSTILLVIVAGSIELPRDIETGGLLFVLSKPVTRAHVLLGKVFGLMTLGVVSVILQSILGAAVLAFRGLTPGSGFLLSVFFIVTKTSILSASVVMFSVWLPEFATLFFSALYLVLALQMNLVDLFVRYFPLDWFLTFLLRCCYYLVPNFSHLALPVNTLHRGGWLFALSTAGYAFFYCLLLIWVSLWGFYHREFSGSD
jgi:ABC-type transport system involved in multi-copper enzyme maturation permease subunit